MFCSTLRRRASFSSAIPTLTANNGLNLRENALNTHDLAIPLPRAGSTADTPRTLRVLLLSPTSTTATAFPATLTRIQHFSALNGSLDSIIIFLLDTPTTSDPPADHPTPLHAYTHLSATLLTDPSIVDVPLLLLSSLASLPALLKTYITTNSTACATQNFRAGRGDAFNTALDLLPWCTANAARAPLGEDEVNVLTDLFGSVGGLAKCAVEAVKGEGEGEWCGDERVGMMRDLLGRQVTDDVLEFWREEWVAE